MLLVKKGLFTPDSENNEWEAVGEFENLRTVKDYAWQRCVQDGKSLVYLCFKAGRIFKTYEALLVVSQREGCVRMEQENVRRFRHGLTVAEIKRRHNFTRQARSHRIEPSFVVRYETETANA